MLKTFIILVTEFSDIVEPNRSSEIDLKFLKKIIQILWEKCSKKVNKKVYFPKSVVYIDANSSPDRIVPYLGGPTATKVQFLYSGSEPLAHEKLRKMVDNVLKTAKELHQFKPVLLALGVQAVLPVVPDEELDKINHLLKKTPRDREGQVIYNYDR